MTGLYIQLCQNKSSTKTHKFRLTLNGSWIRLLQKKYKAVLIRYNQLYEKNYNLHIGFNFNETIN